MFLTAKQIMTPFAAQAKEPGVRIHCSGDHGQVVPLGQMQMRELLPTQKAALNSFLQQKGEELFSDDIIGTYYRVEKEGQTFFSALYTRVQRRNSYTVNYMYGCHNNNKYGSIQFFLKHQSGLLALICPLEVSNDIGDILSLPHDISPEIKPLEKHVTTMGENFTMARRCHPSTRLDVVEISEVWRKCVLVHYEDKTFISAIPNFVECD
ncbi:hypothetical protein ACROYT_G014336 [Oculina patagonica]